MVPKAFNGLIYDIIVSSLKEALILLISVGETSLLFGSFMR